VFSKFNLFIDASKSNIPINIQNHSERMSYLPVYSRKRLNFQKKAMLTKPEKSLPLPVMHACWSKKNFLLTVKKVAKMWHVA
tara:strand:+ start:93 stop:338 length:246 start_codon:yes stop_codon:yes gene_type:complete